MSVFPLPFIVRLGCFAILLLFVGGCAAASDSRSIQKRSSSSSLQIEDLLAIEKQEPGTQLVQIAQQQLGLPYRSGGKTPVGFDCSGLVYFVYGSAGYTVPRTSRDQYRASRRIALDSLAPGDLVFFRVSSEKISHVGIYVADDLFIHSPSSGKGVSYASLGEDYWRDRLVGAGRFY